MRSVSERFLFASAPDSWGVLDYPGPSWKQSYEKMLDEMVSAGYTGTELGPYGFFPTDPKVLQPELDKRNLKLLASFVPVKMTDPSASTAVIERIRKVGNLLAELKAPFLVIADDQSPERNAYSGRAYDKGCPTLTAQQWKHIGNIVADAEKVAGEFGLDLVFHRMWPPTSKRPRNANVFTMRPLIPTWVSVWTPATACTATATP